MLFVIFSHSVFCYHMESSDMETLSHGEASKRRFSNRRVYHSVFYHLGKLPFKTGLSSFNSLAVITELLCNIQYGEYKLCYLLFSVIIFCYHMKSHDMETLSHGETSKRRFSNRRV